LDEIRVDERHWGDGASEVRRWIVEDYDPETMPHLVMGQQDDGFLYLIGWVLTPEYKNGQTLHEAIFGCPLSPDRAAEVREEFGSIE